ncbi:AraC family transcriptional regulator [Rhizobium sp. OAE497]|uniref:AraC family transcriptional regulator n=1 Tax=Rhizobium sp. OAE497 TaxID=2663796 RepID=UPI0018F3FAC9
MDILSRLIDLAGLRTSLDIRCRLEGAFEIDHEPAGRGVIPFHVVLSGSCRLRLPDRRVVELTAGDFLMLPRGEAHLIVGRESGAGPRPVRLIHDGMLPVRENGEGVPDVDLLCGHFDSATGSSLLLDTLPDVFHASLAGAQSEETLKLLVGILRDEAMHQEAGALTIATAICLALLTMALRAQNTAALGTAGLLALIANPRFSRALKAVIANPAEDWTIDRLASLSAMSRATYARQFKETSGMTVAGFVTDLRMTLASDLLIRTRRTVADIAAEVGYDSEAAFGKAFKARRGVPPARFRQQMS